MITDSKSSMAGRVQALMNEKARVLLGRRKKYPKTMKELIGMSSLRSLSHAVAQSY
ncbi:Hypothetical protein FKW44_008939, partial [Caligus rogercresseyi]